MNRPGLCFASSEPAISAPRDCNRSGAYQSAYRLHTAHPIPCSVTRSWSPCLSWRGDERGDGLPACDWRGLSATASSLPVIESLNKAIRLPHRSRLSDPSAILTEDTRHGLTAITRWRCVFAQDVAPKSPGDLCNPEFRVRRNFRCPTTNTIYPALNPLVHDQSSVVMEPAFYLQTCKLANLQCYSPVHGVSVIEFESEDLTKKRSFKQSL